jgi:hypothetical protein
MTTVYIRLLALLYLENEMHQTMWDVKNYKCINDLLTWLLHTSYIAYITGAISFNHCFVRQNHVLELLVKRLCACSKPYICSIAVLCFVYGRNNKI